MIEAGIFSLAERKGSTRQSLWKYLQSAHPGIDYKQFLIRFRKIGENPHVVKVDKNRVKLTKGYRATVIRILNRGEDPVIVNRRKALEKKNPKRKSAKASKKSSKAKSSA